MKRNHEIRVKLTEEEKLAIEKKALAIALDPPAYARMVLLKTTPRIIEP